MLARWQRHVIKTHRDNIHISHCFEGNIPEYQPLSDTKALARYVTRCRCHWKWWFKERTERELITLKGLAQWKSSVYLRLKSPIFLEVFYFTYYFSRISPFIFVGCWKMEVLVPWSDIDADGDQCYSTVVKIVFIRFDRRTKTSWLNKIIAASQSN